ncbi:hypothetical protein HAX54_030459, partial [Datura stramonium]|nr:hypothetical protein [Datura stramonium]
GATPVAAPAQAARYGAQRTQPPSLSLRPFDDALVTEEVRSRQVSDNRHLGITPSMVKLTVVSQ